MLPTPTTFLTVCQCIKHLRAEFHSDSVLAMVLGTRHKGSADTAWKIHLSSPIYTRKQITHLCTRCCHKSTLVLPATTHQENGHASSEACPAAAALRIRYHWQGRHASSITSDPASSSDLALPTMWQYRVCMQPHPSNASPSTRRTARNRDPVLVTNVLMHMHGDSRLRSHHHQNQQTISSADCRSLQWRRDLDAHVCVAQSKHCCNEPCGVLRVQEAV
jgi:hypothetical protein